MANTKKVYPSSLSNKDDTRWHVTSDELIGKNHVKWKDMSTMEHGASVAVSIARFFALLLIIFLFVCTLGLLSTSFKLIGGRGVGNAIKSSSILQNPVSASIVGMVVTLILQSSSTLISLLVGMVAGQLITVHQAIPIMMGSEMGASIMNALISLTQSGNRSQFRRAFAAATMNDIYNFLCFIVLLPTEIILKPVERLSYLVVSPLSKLKAGQLKTLDALTDPILEKIIQIDEDGLNAAATAINVTHHRKTFVLRCIDLETNTKAIDLHFCPYEHIFAYSKWSDIAIGICLLLICIASLIICLLGIVKLMQDLLAGRIAVLLRKIMDKQLPYPFGWLTNYLVMIFGCVVVMVIQSSSVFRSALTPLVGVGVVTLDRLYPLIIGSNVGTTFTGVLAALSADSSKLRETLQMALSQTFYNVFGLLIFYPIPFLRRIPMKLAMKLGDTTAKYRWFALVYILVVFILLPGFLLAISFLPMPVMFFIIGVVGTFIIFVIVVNVLQRKCSNYLPNVLKTWNFLPIWMHSLDPYDKFMTKNLSKLRCCRKCFQQSENDETNFANGFVGQADEPPVAKLIRLSHQTQV